jgi:hypothetical protein
MCYNGDFEKAIIANGLFSVGFFRLWNWGSRRYFARVFILFFWPSRFFGLGVFLAIKASVPHATRLFSRFFFLET